MDDLKSKLDKEIESEKRKISELYRDLKSEGNDDQQTKLQWMYKKPNELVDREEYLLGRSIDKNFDNKGDLSSQDVCNIPERIIGGSETKSERHQVDLEKKIQEDPLYSIRQKEIEARRQLLNNPVKVKQLKQMYANQLKRKQKLQEMMLKNDITSDIDQVILKLLKKLGEDFDFQAFVEDFKNEKKKKNKKKRKTSSSSSDSEEERTERNRKRRKTSPSSSDSENKKIKRKGKKRKTSPSSSDSEEERTKRREKRRKKKYNSSDENEHKRRQKTDKTTTSNKQKERRSSSREDSHRKKYSEVDKQKLQSQSGSRKYGLSTREGSRRVDSSHTAATYKPAEKKEKYIPPKQRKLSEKEIEKQLEEMRKNAAERKRERTDQFNRHKKQLEEEDKTQEYKEDFIRTQVAALSSNSVSERLRSNINNIQRHQSAMDSHFARR